IESGIHQRRRTAGTPPFGGCGVSSQHSSEPLLIATAKRFHEPDSLWVGRRYGSFSREIIGPFRPLIDPGFAELDLLGRARPGGRHLRTVLVSRELQIQPALRAVPGSYRGSVGA